MLAGALIQIIILRLPKRSSHIQFIPLNAIQRPQVHSFDIYILQSFGLHDRRPFFPDLFRWSEDIGVDEDTTCFAKFVSEEFPGELIGGCVFITSDMDIVEGRIDENVAIL